MEFLGTMVAVALVVMYVPGVHLPFDAWHVLLVSLAWTVIVTLIRPVLRVLTLPITILTLGIFSFILNALLFYAMAFIVPGFSIDGFFAALIGSVVLSLVSFVFNSIF